MKREVSILLKDFGIAPHLHGYKFLGEAIELIQADDSLIHQITKVLYPTIAKTFNTKASAVERDIRHSISHGFRRIDKKLLREAFGNTLGSTTPTNSHFIATLVEVLEERMSKIGDAKI